MILKFKVYEQTISLQATKAEPRQGSKDYLELQFSFSSDWSDLLKYVYLQHGEVSVPHDLVGGSIIVDEYFTEQTEFNVTLFGKSADGSVEVPTNVITVFLKESNNLWVKDAPAPQNSWVVQVIDARDEALAAAIRAENAAIRQPYPNSETDTWWVWDADSGAYKDTGVSVGSSITVDSELSDTSENPVQNKVIKSALDKLGVQSDWNQNDGTQPDYIKNRPFYTGGPVETTFVEESTVSFADKGGLYTANFPSTFEATVGETYKVSWDGIVYECTSVSVEGIPAIGNLAILNGGGSDTGEPFIMGIQNGERIRIFTADTSVSHTFSISGLAAEIVKIDAKYLPFPFKPDGISYLTFSSRNSFSLSIRGKSWDGTLEYFASDGTWTVWDGSSSLSAEANGSEYVLYLRGTGNTVITGGSSWILKGFDISCIGNIETLLDYATVRSGGHPVMAGGCYNYMFYLCTSLTQAPELPATTMANYCYQNMFSGCTSLTQAPELPATTLANGCYYMMFTGCTSLTRAPTLPATTLASECYYRMFSGCTSLTQVPALPATTLASECYYRLFYGCTSLKLSETKTEEYTQEYRIPLSGNGTDASAALAEMFISTGGTFTGTPAINTTYYLSSDNMIVRGNDIANLNGYVKSMIDNAGECIPVPATAEVGQTIVVKAVDANGKPTEWEAADMPDKLPNPNALTFTGSVTGTYDGSAPLSVEIPSGGGLSDYELIDTLDWSTEELAQLGAGKEYYFEGIQDIILVYTGVANDTTTVSGLIVVVNNIVLSSSAEPASGKSGTPMNGYVFLHSIPGIGLFSLKSPGAIASNNYGQTNANIPYNLHPVTGKITQFKINNRPYSYRTNTGILKIYVR